jgi:hypothetical protein
LGLPLGLPLLPLGNGFPRCLPLFSMRVRLRGSRDRFSGDACR